MLLDIFIVNFASLSLTVLYSCHSIWKWVMSTTTQIMKSFCYHICAWKNNLHCTCILSPWRSMLIMSWQVDKKFTRVFVLFTDMHPRHIINSPITWQMACNQLYTNVMVRPLEPCPSMHETTKNTSIFKRTGTGYQTRPNCVYCSLQDPSGASEYERKRERERRGSARGWLVRYRVLKVPEIWLFDWDCTRLVSA